MIESIADKVERGEVKQCAHEGCTRTKGLLKPRHLPYRQAKLYTGPVFCLKHNPRFGTDLDLVAVLTGDPFGGDAA